MVGQAREAQQHTASGARRGVITTASSRDVLIIAGRPKDWQFTALLAKAGLTSLATLRARLGGTVLDTALAAVVAAPIEADFPAA